jgi:GcrA cell cycle regulator
MTAAAQQLSRLYVGGDRQIILWTDEKIEQLKELYAAGHSCSVIAERLRTTRNSVIGKVHRLKLTPRFTVQFQWSYQKIEQLRNLCATSLTYEGLAKTLGCSESSVARKLAALGWREYKLKEIRPEPIERRPLDPKVFARKTKPKTPSPHLCGEKDYSRSIRRRQLGWFRALPDTTPVGIVEVTGCRFPVTEDSPFLFCDAPRFTKASYCGYHQRISEAQGPQ